MEPLTKDDIKELKKDAKRLKIKGYTKMTDEELLTAVADALVVDFCFPFKLIIIKCG